MTVLSAVAALVLLAVAPPADSSLRRFGLFVGSNDGGTNRVRLKYATADAQSVARVLEQLGGLAPDRTTVLLTPTRQQLADQLERLRAEVSQIRASGGRTELVLYYSGHADETGLLLGRERLTYGELREAVNRVPAGVRVVILDSCHAGSFVRLKGGQRIAPFLVDTSSAVQGHAFLSSSSADEAAQESDRIRSSYFTFALLSGLRGAADSNRDGKVTLTEAYQFAFQETLAHTERSMAGPQHPAYDMHLAGTGDLVMTDLRAQTAGLVIPADLAGRVFVRDSSNRLVVELNHVTGYALELGLEPGRYQVRLETTAGSFETEAVLTEGKRTELRRTDFKPAQPGERVATRGPESGPESEAPPERSVPVNLSLWPGVALAGDGEDVVTHFGLNLVGRVAEIQGVELGLVNIQTRRLVGAQAGLVNVNRGEALGAQWSLVNYVEGRAVGIQNSALFNHTSGDAWGFQHAGLFNHANGEVRGMQLAGLVNVAGNVQGAQVAGLVNVAREDCMLQLGAVNVGGKVPISIGLVNVADESDAPIGLINWIGNGYRSAGFWMSDVAVANVGMKLGGKYTYGLMAFGFHPFFSSPRYFLTGGLGVHVPVGSWFLDIDVTASMMFASGGFQQAFLPTALRVVAIHEIGGGLSLTTGLTWNVVVGWNGADADLAALSQAVHRDGDVTVRQFPGFVLGIQL